MKRLIFFLLMTCALSGYSQVIIINDSIIAARVSGALGGTDGVVSLVELNGTNLVFTGSNGGFSGTIPLASLLSGLVDGDYGDITVSGGVWNIDTSTITADELAPNSVGASEVVDNALTSAELGTASVNTDELANGSVTSDKIEDGTILTIDYADASIIPSKLAANSPTTGYALTKAGGDAFTWAEIIGLVDGDKGDISVSGSGSSWSIDGSVIGSAEIAENSILSGDIATGAVTTDEILNGTIQEVDLEITNTPTDDHLLSYDLASGGFTWFDPSSIGVADGDKGDITVSGNSWTIDANAINEPDLNISNNPTDGHYLTWDADTNQFTWTAGQGGDNLGSHKATQNVNMSGNDITSIESLIINNDSEILGDGYNWKIEGEYDEGTDKNRLRIESVFGTTAQTNGDLWIDFWDDDRTSLMTFNGNAEITGSLTVNGSPVSGDNLGDHTATQNIDMDGNSINNFESLISINQNPFLELRDSDVSNVGVRYGLVNNNGSGLVELFNSSGLVAASYTFNNTGTPTNATDLITKDYADTNYRGSGSQDLSLTGNTLSLTGDATTVDLSGYLDNTDSQSLALGGNTLSISGGNSVDISGISDGNDYVTTASLGGTTLTLGIPNQTDVTVDLAGLQDGTGTDDQTASEVQSIDTGGYYAGSTVEDILQEIGAEYKNSLETENQFLDDADRVIDMSPSGSLTFTSGQTTMLTVDRNAINFGVNATVLPDAYGSGWDGSNRVPTKDAVYDKIVTVDAQITNNSQAINNLASDVSNLSAVPASQMGFNNQQDNYTLVVSDALDSVIVRLNYNNNQLTIPSGVFSQGQAVRVVKDPSASGETRIVESSGVSLPGYTDGFILGSYPSGVTLARTNSGSPEQWEIVDYFGTLTDYTACAWDASEIAQDENAVTATACKEANAETGWTENGSNITVVDDATTATSGQYYFRSVAFNGSANRNEYSFSVNNGDTFTISLDARQTIGSNAQLTSWANLSGGPSQVSLTGSWTTYNYNVTATTTGTAVVRIYSSVSTGSAGDTVEFDNFSIVKTN